MEISGSMAVSGIKQEENGVPSSALNWFHRILPALSLFSTLLRNDQRPVIIAWDKITSNDVAKQHLTTNKRNGSPKKMYGVFENHEILWRELSSLSLNRRYAYEVIPKSSPCKAYWDIEFTISLLDTQEKRNKAESDVHLLVKQWINELKIQIDNLFGVKAKVCVLKGTRPCSDNDPSIIKFSYHIIAYNVVFESNQSPYYKQLLSTLLSLSDFLHTKKQGDLSANSWVHSIEYAPSSHDIGAPDLCVWRDNQLFRCISCSKRGGSTPLEFADTELTDSLDPMDSFITHFDPTNLIVESGVGTTFSETLPVSKKRRKQKHGYEDFSRKKSRCASPTSGDNFQVYNYDMVQYMFQKYPDELQSIHEQVQLLLQIWHHTNTKVDKLVRAQKNLRYQCINIENRPCIFSMETHISNTPIIWLDAPFTINEGDLSDYYKVIYNCKSSECMCHGIIGEIFLNKNTGLYEHRQIHPAIIQSERGPIRSRIRESQAVMQERGHADIGNTIDVVSEEDPMQYENTAGLMQPVDLLHQRIVGYGWSLEEIRIYGSDNTYQAVKRKMEKSICKICRPHVMYISFQSNSKPGAISDYHHYTYDNMAKNIKHVFYYKKNEQTEAPVPVRFFHAWTDDPKLRSYEHLVFDPSPTLQFTGPSDLNIWPGLACETLPPLFEMDDAESMEDLVEPIRKHILDVIVDGNLDHCEWVLDWLANIIQRPHIKTQVPIVISGKQGVGKGIIFDFFREYILGFGISAQIQNAPQDLFSRFANKHVNKIFLQIDEGEGMAKFADQIKNLITATHLNYEIKGLQPFTTPNFINILITTNHEKPVLVETSDRRYVLFKASDIYLKDCDYYANLASHMKRPCVARAFYDFLSARDLSKYATSFQSTRPLTEYYLQSRKASIPILQTFLSALVNCNKYIVGDPSHQQHRRIQCTLHVLFQDFIRFQETGKFQSTMTQKTFCIKMKAITGIVRKIVQNLVRYEIDYDILRDHLIQSHEFDEDAAF